MSWNKIDHHCGPGNTYVQAGSRRDRICKIHDLAYDKYKYFHGKYPYYKHIDADRRFWKDQLKLGIRGDPLAVAYSSPFIIKDALNTMSYIYSGPDSKKKRRKPNTPWRPHSKNPYFFPNNDEEYFASESAGPAALQSNYDAYYAAKIANTAGYYSNPRSRNAAVKSRFKGKLFKSSWYKNPKGRVGQGWLVINRKQKKVRGPIIL